MAYANHIRIALLAAVVLALVALGMRRYAPYTGRATPKRPPSVVLAMEDVYLVGMGHFGKLWSADAKKVEIGQDRSLAKLKTIRNVRVYDGGKVVLTAKAENACYRTNRKDLLLSDGVEILGADGQKVSGQGAIWNSAASSLRSMGEVSFQSEWGRAIAGSLTANLESKELEMQNVRMRIQLDAIDSSEEAKLQ